MEILEVKNLCKTFGRMPVIMNLSFTVEEGEFSSIIGPNGAGKTTLFNLCSGHFRCTSGRIFYKGERIDKVSKNRRVKLGIGRAFQRVNIFPELTVFENIRVPIISHYGISWRFFHDIATVHSVNERTMKTLKMIGLQQRKDQIAGKLDHGEMKLLDIGIALALEPSLLFLDEPTAGMTPNERKRIIQLIKQIWEERRLTIVLIEHDIDMVFAVSQKVRVLNFGELLAEGSPKEISENPEVVKAYLGEGIDYDT